MRADKMDKIVFWFCVVGWVVFIMFLYGGV
jgi:hypothetical protein